MLDASRSLELAQEFTVETPDTMNNILLDLFQNTAYDFRVWHGALRPEIENKNIKWDPSCVNPDDNGNCLPLPEFDACEC